MALNNTETIIEQSNVYCVYNHNEIPTFVPDMLSSTYWQNKNSIIRTAQGRGTTWFVQYQEPNNNQQLKQWVLRHYYRGGLIGKFNKDHYLYTSQESTRPAREFALLKHMQQLNLPAPKPIAYRVIRCGMFYQADLLSSSIENANDLVELLSNQAISNSLWFKIGAVIQKFHFNGIYHHDLNAHNILVNNQNDIYIIDFDRSELRTNEAIDQKGWQQNNLSRLQRSFLKELKQLKQFHWNNENWSALLEGYFTIN